MVHGRLTSAEERDSGGRKQEKEEGRAGPVTCNGRTVNDAHTKSYPD